MNYNPFCFRSILNARYMLTFSLLIPVYLLAQPAQLNVEILDGSTGAHTPIRVHPLLFDHYYHFPDLGLS